MFVLNQPQPLTPVIPLRLSSKGQPILALSPSACQTFRRSDFVPLHRQQLWAVDQGLVRGVVWNRDGETVTLGLWGTGDVIGFPAPRMEGYRLECVTSVQLRPLTVETPSLRATILQQSMVQQIRRLEFLLSILHSRRITQRVEQLLLWLAQEFGQVTDQGYLLDLSLTHQKIAELAGTSRVTVTRLLQKFAAEGKLIRLTRHRLLVPDGPVV